MCTPEALTSEYRTELIPSSNNDFTDRQLIDSSSALAFSFVILIVIFVILFIASVVYCISNDVLGLASFGTDALGTLSSLGLDTISTPALIVIAGTIFGIVQFVVMAVIGVGALFALSGFLPSAVTSFDPNAVSQSPSTTNLLAAPIVNRPVVQGVRGLPGPVGAQGDPGLPGPQGAVGLQGPAGSDGCHGYPGWPADPNVDAMDDTEQNLFFESLADKEYVGAPTGITESHTTVAPFLEPITPLENFESEENVEEWLEEEEEEEMGLQEQLMEHQDPWFTEWSEWRK